VDFPKALRAAKHPDFMMSKHKQSYASQTIIGQLFREVKVPKPPRLSALGQGPVSLHSLAAVGLSYRVYLPALMSGFRGRALDSSSARPRCPSRAGCLRPGRDQ
jgi:hypothetical protein